MDLTHMGRWAVLKKPWEGHARGIVSGWWSGGLRLVLGDQRLDFAFSEIDRVEMTETTEEAAA